MKIEIDPKVLSDQKGKRLYVASVCKAMNDFMLGRDIEINISKFMEATKVGDTLREIADVFDSASAILKEPPSVESEEGEEWRGK